MLISFHTTRHDADLIEQIFERAIALRQRLNVPPPPEGFTRMRLLMDLTACHANGCELKLAELLKASDADFAHDVFGIERHIDRETGKLGDGFWPRYAYSQTG